ncbi:MAG: cupin domain-containing protein [Opitutus sp.]|nr:cupin domain-containing protein [Opitutus sp.]MCS6246522.1 cupin domain-containing protein [Opitutus sp.]MCS6275635.1 cupin domain-containing protein [Opitutus sp.]MCS6278078.1 cupin domain-containing protein [Opitutus sp.]MCS6298814.1 cupin domain-containing protein [Opitutus sp.]
MAFSVFQPDQCATVPLAPLATPSTAGITSRTLLKTTGGKAVLFAFDAGQELTEHTNPNHALIQVLTGSLHLTLGGRPEILLPGAILHMPPQLPHAVRADEPTTFLLTLLAP